MNTLRIIDANINRVCEGIRVIEDIVRFLYNNEKLFKNLKSIRHEIRKNISNLKIEDKREIETDIGKQTLKNKEIKRENIEDIFRANIKRIEEGLRVLEEIFKIINYNLSEFFKKIRFKIYKIEQILLSKKLLFEKILTNKKPILYGIIDTRFSNYNHIEIAENLIKGGIKIIQLREKILPDKQLLAISKRLKELCDENEVIYIVNDRVDIAILSDSDGLHLGQDDIEINEARKIFGFNKIYGLSTHNFEQVKEACKIKPDYIGFGPIFSTKSKENPDPIVGVQKLKELRKKFKNIPAVVAIGGINFSNIKDVISCKPEMICVMSGIISSEDIFKETKKYMEIIDDSVTGS